MKMKQNEKVIKALREAADWLEQHPELPDLYVSTLGCFSTYDRDIRKDLVVVARAMGHAAKQYVGDSLCLNKDFGGVAQITYVAEREQVCERVVVGTRVVPPVPEKVIPAQPAREEDIVEYRCKPLMNQDQLREGPARLPEQAAEVTVGMVVLEDEDIPF